MIAPPSMGRMVKEAGFSFWPGDEPIEEEVAAIREKLAIVPPDEASVLANRELFGRLAAEAMIPAMQQVCTGWRPDLVLREPCEYTSATVAFPRIPIAQVAISLAEAEAASIKVAAPALEERRAGLVKELLASPYVTSFPPSIDPSPFGTTIRFRQAGVDSPGHLPDWWSDPGAPLVYVTFGSVMGFMSIAADVYRAALRRGGGVASADPAYRGSSLRSRRTRLPTSERAR